MPGIWAKEQCTCFCKSGGNTCGEEGLEVMKNGQKSCLSVELLLRSPFSKLTLQKNTRSVLKRTKKPYYIDPICNKEVNYSFYVLAICKLSLNL